MTRHPANCVPVSCCASLEGQPVFGVVYEDLVHLVLRDAPRKHLRHNVVEDVRVAVTAVLGEPVLGVDVMGDHDLVLVALLDEKAQAAARRRGTLSSADKLRYGTHCYCQSTVCALFCSASVRVA